MSLIHNKLLIEKYRPKTLSEVIADKELDALHEIVKNNAWDIPNLILSTRSAGTGKTSIAKAIVNELNTDCLFLNASDDRGITTVRERIKEFAMTCGFNKNAPKIVHLDEADGLTKEAQESLRGIIEQYSSNCRFIFTCNNESKIIEPIKSRCVQYNLNSPPKEKIFQRLQYICTEENINLKSDVIENIIAFHYPDIRSMINVIDQYKYFETIDLTNSSEKIYNLIKNLKFTDARKTWVNEQIVPRNLIKYIYNAIIADKDISKDDIIRAVEIIAESDYRIAIGADAEITLANMSLQLINDIFK